jgi:4-diphosphocytidyl-2-C-methyl-D-erythritol kinase
MSKILIKAYGKVNLTLDVLGKRVDGYHEIRTIFQGISLHDQVIIEKGEKGIELTCNIAELGTGTENLAYKAAQLFIKKFPQIFGIRIQLDKKIPLAAGLAGGSTDAAAVLVGLNRLYKLNLSLEQLRQYGAKLGSDVPFCLYPLTAIGEGRGEIIRDCPPCPKLWLVVAKPPFNVSTKEVYQHVSWSNLTARPEIDRVLQGMQENNKDLIYRYIANTMECSTFDLYPQLVNWKKELEKLGAKKVIMSGSGPSLLAFTENKLEAEKLASSLNKPGWDVEVASTVNRELIEGRVVLENEREKISYRRNR